MVDISLDVLPHYVGRMATWHNAGYHRDIGTLASWQAAQRDFPTIQLPIHTPDPWAQVLGLLSTKERSVIEALLAPPNRAG